MEVLSIVGVSLVTASYLACLYVIRKSIMHSILPARHTCQCSVLPFFFGKVFVAACARLSVSPAVLRHSALSATASVGNCCCADGVVLLTWRTRSVNIACDRDELRFMPVAATVRALIPSSKHCSSCSWLDTWQWQQSHMSSMLNKIDHEQWTTYTVPNPGTAPAHPHPQQLPG